MSRTRFDTLLLLALTGVFLYLSVFILPASPRLLQGDQFINFDNARRMVQGETLYRDIFQYTLPGTELLEAPLIAIFGAKLAILQVLIIIIGVIEMCLAMVMAAPLLDRRDAALAGLLYICFGYHCGLDATHHKFSVSLVYAATAILVSKRSTTRLMVAGTLLGLATGFTQTRGLVALGVGAFLIWENQLKPREERHLLLDEVSLLAPFSVMVALACAYVLWKAGVGGFYRNIIRFPFLFYRAGDANNWASSFDDLVPTVRGAWQWIMIKLMVPGAYLAFLAYHWRAVRRGSVSPQPGAMLLAVVGVALFLSIAYAPQHVRMAGISLPAFILALWMLNRSPVPGWRIPAWAAAGAFMVLATIFIQHQRYWYYDAPAGHLAIGNEIMYDELSWVDKRTQPGDYVFDAVGPTLYVLLDLQNPARVPFIEPDEYTRPRQVVRTLRRLRRLRPLLVIWPFEPDDSDDPGDRLFLLGRELRKHYRATYSLRDGEVWERKDLPRDGNSKSQIPEPSRPETPPHE